MTMSRTHTSSTSSSSVRRGAATLAPASAKPAIIRNGDHHHAAGANHPQQFSDRCRIAAVGNMLQHRYAVGCVKRGVWVGERAAILYFGMDPPGSAPVKCLGPRITSARPD